MHLLSIDYMKIENEIILVLSSRIQHLETLASPICVT